MSPTTTSKTVNKPGKLEVELQKGAVGLGFCIEGGKGSPLGDRPITVKRLFKGISFSLNRSHVLVI